MLHHPDRHNPVEAALHVAVVALLDLDGQARADVPGHTGLLAGRSDTCDRDTVLGGREPGEASPAAADVEQPHARL